MSPRSTSIRDQSVHGSSAAAHSAMRSANTGEASSSSRPMPTHCVPCPGNTHTTLPGVPARPVTTWAALSPRASARSPLRASSGEPATTTARSPSAARPDTSAPAASASATASASARNSASRPACPASDAVLRADTTTGSICGGTAAAASGAVSCGGASSRIRWALVPLTPNADTPARRGRSARGHSRASVSSSTAPADQSTSGVGASTCRVAGRTPWRSACTILITPATPAAACACPMFDFNDPSHNGRSGSRPCPYVASSACASIGSPREVPVPCASTASTSAADSPALARARRMTRCWDGPLGAVSPLEAPSWLTALPRRTASTWCPRSRATDSRSRTTTPTPSAQPVPSAAAANALQRPSAASPRCRENSTKAPGFAMTVAPPASAMEHSPCRSDCAARCIATSDDEHAVSMVTAGPSKPNTYDTRPDATLDDPPVPANPSSSGVTTSAPGAT